MLFRMAYLVCKVKIFRQRPYAKLGGNLMDALLRVILTKQGWKIAVDATEDDDLQQLLQRLSEEDRQAVNSIIQLDPIDKLHRCRFGRPAPSYVGETVKHMLETLQKNLSNNDKKIIQSAVIRALQNIGGVGCALLYKDNQHLWTGF